MMDEIIQTRTMVNKRKNARSLNFFWQSLNFLAKFEFLGFRPLLATKRRIEQIGIVELRREVCEGAKQGLRTWVKRRVGGPWRVRSEQRTPRTSRRPKTRRDEYIDVSFYIYICLFIYTHALQNLKVNNLMHTCVKSS